VTRRVHLHISGHVQGVGFRYAARREALALGLAGWVRNDADGTVDAVVQGDDVSVQQFVYWAREGPAGAWVSTVDVIDEPPERALTSFAIRG
jgi:acylphosphatase